MPCIQTSISLKPEIVYVRVEKLLLFEPVILQRKAFWGETDLWVTLGEFPLKNAKLGKEICIWLKFNSGRNKICSAEDTHSYMSNIYAQRSS